MSFSQHIKSPDDLKALSMEELGALAQELRSSIIEAVSTKEGHLGASLGVVELTIALHTVFDTPKDTLIWDVGHQAYGHKMLTGRWAEFSTNRQWDGLSGFPVRAESVYDAFGTGHSSTAISAALGMALVDGQKRNNHKHIAVVGDAALCSGMALEGLNHAGATQADLLIVFNDNAMGIDPSVGGLKEHFSTLTPGTPNLFTAMGLAYEGPVDGHHLPELIAALKAQKKRVGPRVLHVKTVKGKGLAAAERDQVTYHAPGKFDKDTGVLSPNTASGTPPKYPEVFGATLAELMRMNPKIWAITPAMPSGSGLKTLMELMPDRVIDVGIAEQHAVTLAAGIAAQGGVPICCIYSTFLQRGYDQIIHDVALQKLPVIFAIDRAGLVGADGATHQGVFDLAFLGCIPDLWIAAPQDEIELRNLLYTAQKGLDRPMAIRYPRGNARYPAQYHPFALMDIGRATRLGNQEKQPKIAVLTTGVITAEMEKAIEQCAQPDAFAHYHFPFVKPLDRDALSEISRRFDQIITAEEGCISGGFGASLVPFLIENSRPKSIKHLGVPDRFIPHGTPDQQKASVGLDLNHLIKTLNECV